MSGNRVLIVGEAPGRRAGGLTRRRVSELAGVPYEEWADWINLLDDYPGPSPGNGKGAGWNARAAAARARTLLDEISGYDAVVLLGRRVAQVMIPSGAGFPLFRWMERGGTRVAVCPHTSGIVRWWNDPANVEKARAFFRQLASEPKEAPVAEQKKDEVDLQAQLLAKIKETVEGKIVQVEKKGYVRLNLADRTLAYVHRPTRSGVRVEVPAEEGGYDEVRVAKPGEIRTAVALVKKRADKAKALAEA